MASVVFAVFSATGFALNVLQVLHYPLTWLPLIGFVIFTVLTFVRLGELYKENTELLNAKPCIEVQPLKEKNDFYLKVYNTGGEGKFRAQVRLSSDDPSVRCLPNYQASWKYSNKEEAEILQKHDDWIRIASSELGDSAGFLKIWYFDKVHNYTDNITTSSHFWGATITNTKGKTRPLKNKKYTLDVVISSSPSLRGGAYQGKFLLGISEFKQVFPQSNSQPESIS